MINMNTSVEEPPIWKPALPPSIFTPAGGPQRSAPLRHVTKPRPYFTPTIKAPFFIPGIITAHSALSSKSRETPLSGVCMISRKASVALASRISGVSSSAETLAGVTSAIAKSAGAASEIPLNRQYFFSCMLIFRCPCQYFVSAGLSQVNTTPSWLSANQVNLVLMQELPSKPHSCIHSLQRLSASSRAGLLEFNRYIHFGVHPIAVQRRRLIPPISNRAHHAWYQRHRSADRLKFYHPPVPADYREHSHRVSGEWVYTRRLRSRLHSRNPFTNQQSPILI